MPLYEANYAGCTYIQSLNIKSIPQSKFGPKQQSPYSKVCRKAGSPLTGHDRDQMKYLSL